jgi:hypothetical protein
LNLALVSLAGWRIAWDFGLGLLPLLMSSTGGKNVCTRNLGCCV